AVPPDRRAAPKSNRQGQPPLPDQPDAHPEAAAKVSPAQSLHLARRPTAAPASGFAEHGRRNSASGQASSATQSLHSAARREPAATAPACGFPPHRRGPANARRTTGAAAPT